MSKTEEKKCRCGNSCNNEPTAESALLDAIKRILPRNAPPHIAMLIDSYVREFAEELWGVDVCGVCDNCEACADKETCPVLIFRAILEHREEDADKSPPAASEKEESEKRCAPPRIVCSLCGADGSLDNPYQARTCIVCDAILDSKGVSREKSSQKKESVGELGGVLKEAHDLIHGDRREAYGSAKDSFDLIARLWNNYLRVAGKRPGCITPRDVAMLMVLFKVAREANKFSTDNLIDICGYAALAENL